MALNRKLKFFATFLIHSVVFQLVHSCYEDPSTCDERVFGRDSFVCVCDAEYCDIVGDVSLPEEENSFKRIISSRDKHRFSISTSSVENTPTGDVLVKVDYDRQYQTVLGFGGAFTDSAGIALVALPEKAQEAFFRSYFSETGIEYNLCRVPIAGTDFSTHPYSYDDVDNDVNLEHFSLTKEDFLYKIPFIKKAQSLASREVRLFASPWGAPAWMKENGKHNGKGGLLKEMWNPYANYLIRFFEDYMKNNISFWGLTTTNEPLSGFEDWPWNACAWSAEDMRDWIKTSFGPSLTKANFEHLKVMISDQGRHQIPAYPETILQDEVANKFVDGVAVHWYNDLEVSPQVLDDFQSKFKDKFLLYTEACLGVFSPAEDKVQLGSWERAQIYASDIIENLNHFSSGWIDWNMALDMEGGPNWAGNVVDAAVIINKKEKEFYKQPMFYAMGHFSKFIPPGAWRLLARVEESSEVQVAAFYSELDDSYVFVILNKSDKERRISVETLSKRFININLEAKSLETVLIRRSQ